MNKLYGSSATKWPNQISINQSGGGTPVFLLLPLEAVL